MRAKYIPPAEVKSPKDKWVLAKVLIAGSEKKGALSIGWYKEKPVFGMRWNGSRNHQLGTPHSHNKSTWFIVPDRFAEAIVESLHGGTKKTARKFFDR